MRVYVAGASAEIDRCERFRDRCIAAGHAVTFDWMAHVRSTGSANIGLTREQRELAALACLDGVSNADVFVLLFPRAVTVGAWVEFGFALRCPLVRVIVVGDDDSSVMTAAWEVEYARDEDEALALIETKQGVTP
jgi:hypothetical protein